MTGRPKDGFRRFGQHVLPPLYFSKRLARPLRLFLSPCLDSALRWQAIGRCHRIGQRRPVVVTDLAVRGSLEEKVGAPSPRSSRDLRRSLVLTSTCPRAQALDLIDLEQRPRELRGESGGEVHDQHRLRLAELCLKELGRR